MHSSKDTAHRILALLAVSSHATDPLGGMRVWVTDHGIDRHLSIAERTFLSAGEPVSQQQVIDFSWRSEAAVALAWALGGEHEMPSLAEQVTTSAIPLLKTAVDDPARFVAQAQLRNKTELEDMEGHLYHQHWRVRDAQLFRKAMPAELHPGIVYERRYALSWLVGGHDDWDEVPTDT